MTMKMCVIRLEIDIDIVKKLKQVIFNLRKNM